MVQILTSIPDQHDWRLVLLAAAAVAVTAILILVSVAGVGLFAVRRFGQLRRLREAMDVMPEGIAFFDKAERLVAWNARYAELCRQRSVEPVSGLAFDDMISAGVEAGSYPDAVNREGEWTAERRAVFDGERESLVVRTLGGGFIRVSERQTPDGGTASICVDITDSMQAEADAASARDRAEALAHRAEIAEAVAGLGHWRVEIATQKVEWSDELYRIYGLQPGDPLDFETLMAKTHPEDLADARERLTRQIETGPVIDNFTTRFFRPDGELRYLAGRSSVERDADGVAVRVIGTVMDVTDQKLAELARAQSEERFRRLAVNAPDIITESALDGTMTYLSPACLAITGFSPEELVGQKFASLMQPDDAAKVQKMCRAVFQSRGERAPWPVEFRAVHKNGREVWLECKPTPSRDPVSGRYVGLTDVIRDITPRKVLEAELREARAEAEAAASVKADFLANMSHELRTPITSIVGFTNLTLEQPELSNLTRDYVGRVRDASRALISTVNDILDFSKLEAGQVTISPKPTDVEDLLAGTLNLFAPQAGAKDVQLRLEIAPAARGLVAVIDPDRIRQIVLNLVGNAVKFTGEGEVTLKATYEPSDCRLKIGVIDTGPGIDPDKLGSLFQRFSQIDGSLTRHGGTGLGLAICKGLAEAMGGRIGVESSVGVGSEFWFEVIAGRASTQAVATSGAMERMSFEGVRVLVVDDHQTNRELARLYLAGVGAEVSLAESGKEAVEMAANWPFDVILMDLRMPDMDGYETCALVQLHGSLNEATPVLAFTADVSPTLTQDLTTRGFEGIVAKPLEISALVDAIARATDFAATIPSVEATHAA